MSEQAVGEQSQITRTITGKVISAKMDKTIVVLVVRKVLHSRYKKYIKRNTKLYAHDEKNESKEGDVVMIEQCRPLSKLKAWKLIKVVGADAKEQITDDSVN